MPVKYSQEFQVPKEYPDVLRNLTREILRQQPKDINKFGELPLTEFTLSCLDTYQLINIMLTSRYYMLDP